MGSRKESLTNEEADLDHLPVVPPAVWNLLLLRIRIYG